MPLELSAPPASATPGLDRPARPAAASDPTSGPSPEGSRPEDSRRDWFLASAWHHVAEASHRIEQLQARLQALGVVSTETSLP